MSNAVSGRETRFSGEEHAGRSRKAVAPRVDAGNSARAAAGGDKAGGSSPGPSWGQENRAMSDPTFPPAFRKLSQEVWGVRGAALMVGVRGQVRGSRK